MGVNVNWFFDIKFFTFLFLPFNFCVCRKFKVLCETQKLFNFPQLKPIILLFVCSSVNLQLIPKYIDYLLKQDIRAVFGKCRHPISYHWKRATFLIKFCCIRVSFDKNINHFSLALLSSLSRFSILIIIRYWSFIVMQFRFNALKDVSDVST